MHVQQVRRTRTGPDGDPGRTGPASAAPDRAPDPADQTLGLLDASR
ncbi:MAG: hypothetical protein HKP61_05080 [Dactylosporangium sp.]|nr:hypothetical protein [Dactylosporangium sp.]